MFCQCEDGYGNRKKKSLALHNINIKCTYNKTTERNLAWTFKQWSQEKKPKDLFYCWCFEQKFKKQISSTLMVGHQRPCYKVFSTFVVNYFVTTLIWVHNQLLQWAIKCHFLYERKLKVSKLELKLGVYAKECKHTPISKETSLRFPSWTTILRVVSLGCVKHLDQGLILGDQTLTLI